MHTLARCYYFCNPLKKSDICPSNQVSAAAVTSTSDEKWRLFNFFFSLQGTGGCPTGPDLESRVDDKDTGRSGMPVSSGLQSLGVPGQCSARIKPPW